MENEEVKSLPTLYTYSQVAEMLKLHPGTVRGWVCKRKLPHYKINGAIRFSMSQIRSIVKIIE